MNGFAAERLVRWRAEISLHLLTATVGEWDMLPNTNSQFHILLRLECRCNNSSILT